MRKGISLAIVTASVACGALCADAGDVGSLSKHHRALVGQYLGPFRSVQTKYEGRGAYEVQQPAPAWNVIPDYGSVGLSDNPDDCNKGCAYSNGS